MTLQVQSNYMIPVGHPNRKGVKLTKVLALVIHYTANYTQGANDIANSRYFNRTYEYDNGRFEEAGTDDPFRYASAQYIVDMDSMQLCIPENEMAYHVGSTTYTPFALKTFRTASGSCVPNLFTIGIEMCVNAGNDWAKTVENTAELTSDIMVKYNIPMDMLLRHYDITGKVCPKPYVDDPKAWQDFKALVARKVAQKKQATTNTGTISGVIQMFKDVKESNWAYKAIEDLSNLGILKGDTEGNFNPDKPITRAEIAVVIYRVLKLIGFIKE
jgi:N-acetylmuramoyl-L-alanine amidase